MERSATPPPYTPPAPGSLLNADHVRVYKETNGEEGYIWNGAPILLLTTMGRKSKQERTIPIIFTPYKDGWVIMASQGGAPTHPGWYHNLQDDPHAKVQVKGDVYEAIARTAQSPEREAIWAEALKVWPNYDVYQWRATARQIPVVVLEPQRKL